MKRLVLVAALFVSGCSDPRDAVLPTNEKEWNEDLRAKVEKLPEKERELLAAYMVRKTVGTAFGGEPIAAGTTIGKAIEEQRDFEAERKKEEEAAAVLKAQIEAKRAATKAEFGKAMTVALISKGYTDSDVMSGIYEDTLDIEVAFRNNSTKDIMGVKGVAIFADIFGDEIMRSGMSVDDEIKAGQAHTWNGSIDYNQFMDEHQKLRNISQEKLKFAFEPEVVLFADGTKLEMPSAE